MPACLYQSDVINETTAEAMGWGSTSFGGKSSDELLKGFLNLVNTTTCNEHYYDDTEELPTGIISTQICAGDSTRRRDTW
jgi:hypothetical protein